MFMSQQNGINTADPERCWRKSGPASIRIPKSVLFNESRRNESFIFFVGRFTNVASRSRLWGHPERCRCQRMLAWKYNSLSYSKGRNFSYLCEKCFEFYIWYLHLLLTMTPAGVIPSSVLITPTLTHFFVEELRTARRYLSKADLKDIDSLKMYELNEHTGPALIEEYVKGVNQWQRCSPYKWNRPSCNCRSRVTARCACP